MTHASEAARRRLMSEAHALLERIVPPEAGSPEPLDEDTVLLVRELERQAIAPSPNVVEETEDGVTLTWE